MTDEAPTRTALYAPVMKSTGSAWELHRMLPIDTFTPLCERHDSSGRLHSPSDANAVGAHCPLQILEAASEAGGCAEVYGPRPDRRHVVSGGLAAREENQF